MIFTATLTDQFGRRPLTVYPFGVTVISVLCLGIIGCLDCSRRETSALLVHYLGAPLTICLTSPG